MILSRADGSAPHLAWDGRELKSELDKAGIKRDGRVGYAVGLSYSPDWSERTILFARKDQTELEAGMTFHFMSGLWMDDWGIEITESVLIRPEGPMEAFCSRPWELFAKE